MTEKTIEQIDAEMAVLASAREEKLKASKDADLEIVKKLCKQHGFTATNLRGVLAVKGKKSKVEKDGTKPAAKKAPVKRTTTKSK